VFDFALPFSVKLGGLVTRVRKDISGGAFSYLFTPPGGATGQLAKNHDVIAEGFPYGHDFKTNRASRGLQVVGPEVGLLALAATSEVGFSS